jgi:hypothetical protein
LGGESSQGDEEAEQAEIGFHGHNLRHGPAPINREVTIGTRAVTNSGEA